MLLVVLLLVANIISLYKKCGRTVPSNFKGISLINTPYKLNGKWLLIKDVYIYSSYILDIKVYRICFVLCVCVLIVCVLVC